MINPETIKEQSLENPSIFYNGDFFDHIFQASPRYSVQNLDIKFWIEMAERYGPSILELACGTGRISVPLSEHGFDVTGIDLSDSMLLAARQKSQQVHWIQADVRNFNLHKSFSLIAFPYDTFTHLHELGDIKACLRCVRQHLDSDGYFIIDFKNPYYVVNYLNNPDSKDIYAIFTDPYNGQKVTAIRESQYDAVKQIYYFTLEFSWEGKTQVIRENLKLRIFFPKEIEAILSENGFKVVQKFGNYQQESFNLNSSHHILICQPT